MAETIALFPLSHVLLPGMPLPLHVFERRYQDLLDDLAAQSAGTGDGSFGVVALRSGTEAVDPTLRVGADSPGGTTIEQVGTLAEIVELDRRSDGTADLLAVGARRFRIVALRPHDRAYLRADVEFLPETDGELDAALVARIRDLVQVYDEVLVRLAGRATGSGLPRDPAVLAYQVAARLPLVPADRQLLLADPDTAGRLTRLGGLLRRELALLRGTRSIAVAPSILRLAAGHN